MEAFSRESEDSTSESASLPHGSANTTNIAEASSNGTGPEFPSTQMFGNSEPTPHTLMCSTADIPVSPSLLQANEREPTTPVTFGPSSPDSFAFYDHESLSVRMSQATLLSDSEMSLLILPRWGWMCGGELYERQTPEHHTEENDCSGLLPTPTGDDANNVTRESGSFQSLARTAHSLLPTPTARDGKGSGQNPEQHLRQRRLTGIEHRQDPGGDFTTPQSDDGKPSQEQPHNQLTIEDA